MKIGKFWLWLLFAAAMSGCSRIFPSDTVQPLQEPVSPIRTVTATPFLPEQIPTGEASSPALTRTVGVLENTLEMEEESMDKDTLQITIVYNNVPSDPRLTTDWGFSAYVTYSNQVVLFDTGTDGFILLENMRTLQIDPASIQSVVLSHVHDDHTGGLADFLAVSPQPPVYLLSSFGSYFIARFSSNTKVIETTPGQVIGANILSTGEVSGTIPEQALVIRTPKGLVVMTGCAHPGILRMLEKAVEITGGKIYLVLGGFHLGSASRAQITSILEGFRSLGVEKVAPSHCTGDLAMRMFADEYGQDFLSSGLGSILTIVE